jgi:hypothetical protein
VAFLGPPAPERETRLLSVVKNNKKLRMHLDYDPEPHAHILQVSHNFGPGRGERGLAVAFSKREAVENRRSIRLPK